MLTGVGMDVVRDLSGAATGSLIAAVWQGALLAGAAALGMRMLPKTPAAVRFVIWFSVFVVVTALPFAAVGARGGITSGVLAGGHSAWFTLNARWSEGVLLLWVAVSLVRLGMLLAGAVRVHALWRRAEPIEVGAVAQEAVAPQNAFGRKIQICTSDGVDRPSVIGFFAPKILIPAWLVARLTPDEMAQVVLHEAGHLRRGDDWLNLLQKMALVVFPLNPALAWVERRLCFEREMACDEQVLRATGAPKAYASCLTSLAEHRMTRRGMALVMGAVGRESELGQRVRRILARGESMRPARARLVMGGGIVALLAGAAGLGHCPPLVGFSSGSDALAASVPLTTAKGYEDVVYRPAAAMEMRLRSVETVARQPLAGAIRPKRMISAGSGGAQIGKAAATAETMVSITPGKSTVRQVRQMMPAGGGMIDRRANAERVQTTEWVVMTSWSADAEGYGGRVLMTSIAARPAPQHSPNASVPTTRTQVIQQAPVMEQVSPYAAVPVRGGWLVIQL